MVGCLCCCTLAVVVGGAVEGWMESGTSRTFPPSRKASPLSSLSFVSQ